MSPQLVLAITAMTLAVTLYTAAVWSEQSARVLKPWHLGLFWVGLVFDTTGTTIMSGIAGGFRFNLHGTIGAIAVALMLGHAVWASIALAGGRERVLKVFHKFSVHVWALWMVAFLSGIVMVALKG